jgi:DNA-binding beta-propeller fold protein YncE
MSFCTFPWMAGGTLLLATLLGACQTLVPAASDASSPRALAATGLALSAIQQISVGKSPHGIAVAQGFVYNADTGAGQFSVIDTKTQSVVKTLPVAAGRPGYLKAFHDGRHMLGADTQTGQLLVFDPAQDHRVLQSVLVGQGIDRLVIAPDDRRVWVSLTGEPRIVELTFEADRAKAPARRDIGVGGVAGEQFKHRALAVSADFLVAPNSAENDVSLVNLASGEARRVSGGNNPGPVAIGTTDGVSVAAIVGFKASNAVTLFELPGGKAHPLDEVGLTPSDMGVDARLGRAYVTMSGSNDVAVIDYLAKRLVGRVPVGKRPVHIYAAPALEAAQTGEKAPYALLHGTEAAGLHEWWVGNDDGGSVTVFDGETLNVKATIATGAGHHKMAFWGRYAYVSNLTDNTVSVIDRDAIR